MRKYMQNIEKMCKMLWKYAQITKSMREYAENWDCLKIKQSLLKLVRQEKAFCNLRNDEKVC